MSDCAQVYAVDIPGPRGLQGPPGTDGEDGADAFTFSTASFVMPAEGASVIVNVENAVWAAIGQVVFVGGGGAMGYFQVDLLPFGGTSIGLINIKNTAASAYLQNSLPGTVFPNSSKIAPAGIQGPIGPVQSGALIAVNNLSDVVDAAVSYGNLGGKSAGKIDQGNTNGRIPKVDDASGLTSGESLFATATGIESVDAPTTRSRLGLVKGIADTNTPQVNRVSGLVDGEVLFATTTGIKSVDAAAARVLLGVSVSGYLDYLLYREEQASGVIGSPFSATFWSGVGLNTEVVDEGNHGSITAGDVTLAAGTYRYRFGVVATGAAAFQGRLFNVTDAAVVAGGYGCSAYSVTNDISFGSGRFVIASPKAFRLQGWHAVTGVSFGSAVNSGGPEIYSFLEFWKE